MRESSTNSLNYRTSSASTTESKDHNLVTARTHYVDALFPLYEIMTKDVHLPKFMANLPIIIILIQALLQSFWAPELGFQFSGSILGRISKYLVYALLWFDPNNPTKINQVFALFSMILFFASLFFLCYIIFLFQRTSNAPILAIYLFRFIIEVVVPITIIPSATIAAQMIVDILIESVSYYVIIEGIISSISSIFFYYIYYTHYMLISRSSSLPRFFIVTFLPEYYVQFIKIMLVTQYASFIFSTFPTWGTVVMAVIHSVVHITLVVKIFYIPFLVFQTNCAFAAVSCTIIFNNLLQLLPIFIKDFFPNIVLVSTFVLIIVFWVLFYYIFYAIRKSVANTINPNLVEQNVAHPNDKIVYLENLHIAENPYMYLLYLNTAITTGSDFFIDGSILRYWFELFDNDNINAVVALIASFIPYHGRILNSAYSRFVKRAEMSFTNRFLIFSLSRVKIYRQSTNSGILLEALSKTRMESKKAYELLRGFLTNPPNYASSFNTYRNCINIIENQWKDFINSYPNANSGYADYATFVTEAKTEFSNASLQHHKLLLLEDGHSLTKDTQYRSFIWHFPFYLKHGILDTKGNLIHRNDNNMSSKSHHSSNSSISLEMINEIAPEEEEASAKALFTAHRLRLAFQRATENMIPRFSMTLKYTALFVTIIIIVFCIVIDIYLTTYFDERVESVREIRYLNDARFYMSSSRLCTTFEIARAEGIFSFDEHYEEIVSKDKDIPRIIDFSGDLIQQTIYFQYQGNENFNTFIDMLVEAAISGRPIYEIASVFLSQSLNITICDHIPSPLEEKAITSLKSMYSFISVALASISKNEQSTWKSTTLFCEIINNLERLEEAYEQYYDSAILYEQKVGHETENFFLELDIIVPIVIFVFMFVPISILVYLNILDLKNMISFFRDLPQSFRENCIRPISKSISTEETTSTIVKESNIFYYYYSVIFILSIIIPILVLDGCIEASEANNDFEKIADWMLLGSSRAPMLSECLEHLCLAIMFHGPRSIQSTNRNYEIKEAEKLEQIATEHHLRILNGNDELEPCIYFDSYLDEIHFALHCNPMSNATETHERYRCSSLSNNIAFFSTFVKESIATIDTISSLSDDVILNLIHLLNSHMSVSLTNFTERLYEISILREETFRDVCNIIVAVGILVAVVNFFIILYISRDIDSLYHIAFAILRRIPPHQIILNKSIQDFILNRKQAISKNSLSISHHVIFNHPDGIVFLSKAGIIEMVNESISTILGYAPDQVLGQNIRQLFNDDEINQKLTLLRSGEGKEYFEIHTICIADNTQQIPCDVKIFVMKVDDHIDSFVVIIKDESELIKKQQESEESKRMSENLLFQILPRNIVTRLNQGESDATFVVQIATIMYIDIVRFSDYASNLTPQQIMNNLSAIFESYDRNLRTMSTITKIKIIGDSYLCASGLFTPDDPPKTAAEEMVKFALDCLSEIDTINSQFETVLNIRIGINTGGPIIGGIIGNEKPTFDILGEAISIANKLQHTSIPGKIQITSSTYELVKHLDLLFEHRDDVYLEGKGRYQTYILSSHNPMLTGTDITSSLLGIYK